MERSGPTALRGSFTQTPDLGARRGFWNDIKSPARWTKRTYGLRRVVYPDPPSRGEKGLLEHEERLPRPPDPEARRGFWNDMESPVRFTTWKEADL